VTLFTILQHVGEITDSATVSDLIFCHDFGNGISSFFSFVGNSCDFVALFSLACLISCKPFKILRWFLAYM
jgi:hypothetical protein